MIQSSNRKKLFNHSHFGSHTKSKDQFTSRIHYNSIASEPIFIGCCFVVLPNFRAHRRPSKLSWQAQDPFLPKRPIQNLRSRHIKKECIKKKFHQQVQILKEDVFIQCSYITKGFQPSKNIMVTPWVHMSFFIIQL